MEHVGGDATKFGLKRNGALANGDSELVLKASNEKTRTSWVMKLRQLTLPAPLITQDPLTQNKKKIDIDMNSNLPKTSVSSLNGIVMRKGSQDSGLPKADFAFTDEPVSFTYLLNCFLYCQLQFSFSYWDLQLPQVPLILEILYTRPPVAISTTFLRRWINCRLCVRPIVRNKLQVLCLILFKTGLITFDCSYFLVKSTSHVSFPISPL